MPSASNPAWLHAGLCVLRLGIGTLLLIHGYPLLTGGAPLWYKLGLSMKALHITFLPVFWGFLLALAQAVGGGRIARGVRVRPAAFLAFCAMLVPVITHVRADHALSTYQYPLVLAIVAVSLLLSGGGSYAFGYIILPLRDRWFQ